jgi:integrase
MRVFKNTYHVLETDKLRTSSNWTIEFRDPRASTRKVLRVKAFKDRSASIELGRKLLQLAEFRASGEPPDVPLRRWLGKLEPRIRLKLSELDLLGDQTIEGHRPIIVETEDGVLGDCHLSDYRKSMEADARAIRHIDWTISQVKKTAEKCGFIYLSDITAEKVKAYLVGLAAGGTARKPIKARSFNGYVTALKSFMNWAVKDGRIDSSPLATLHKREIVDATERRALLLDEAAMLLAVTAAAPDRFGMSGGERALVYRVALETGLRAGELQSLRRASFELAEREPVVKVSAASTKNRKAARIHLNIETANTLAVHLKHKLPAAMAFNLPDFTHTAEMFRADCADARAAWIAAASEGQERIDRASGSFLAESDEAGRVLVFHALRHTRGVWLFEHFGASSREVQELMRVSSIALVDRYARSFKVGGRDFASRSPDLSPSQFPDVAAATKRPYPAGEATGRTG